MQDEIQIALILIAVMITLAGISSSVCFLVGALRTGILQ